MPLVVAIEMGYGHLRPAKALASALGARVFRVDQAPLAGTTEQGLWKRTRTLYEGVSRVSQVPMIGRPLGTALEALTFIPHLYPYRDLSKPTLGARSLQRFIERGLGEGLVDTLRQSGDALLTTFFAPAVIADNAGLENIYCVVTDTDINRVWVPSDPKQTRIQYLVPSLRAQRRLRSYGVPDRQIEFTGFPLPDELLGGRSLGALKANLGARLVRLDPHGEFRSQYQDEIAHFLGALPVDPTRTAPLLTFAVGGAGAQAELVRQFLPSLRASIDAGKLRLALVAGTRRELAARFRTWIHESGLNDRLNCGVEILEADNHEEYFDRFNALVARTDILWTKPSEVTFFGALGLPLVFSSPVGVHENYNRRWALESGAGVKQGDPRYAGEWLADWIADGTLAHAAWCGFMRLPKFGLYRIIERVQKPDVRAR